MTPSKPRWPAAPSIGRRGRLAVGAWLTLSALACAAAGAPEIEYLFPAGGQQGARFEVIVGGKLDPWPVGVWTDDAGIRFGPGLANGVFEVAIDPGVAPGGHLVRVYTSEGASKPALFMVGADPEVTHFPQSPTNRVQAAAPPAPVPVTLNGQLGSADAPLLFPIEAGADRVVRARFMASSLDSPAQASLALLKDGTPLVTTLGPAGRDFELRCPILAGGPLSLEVTALAGSHVGDAAVFRVEVTDDPLAAIPRSRATSASSEGVTAFRPMTSARTLAIPGQTRGVISPEGRVIHYSFSAHQNEQFRFVARAGSIGSPLAPVVRVLDLDRTVLAESLPGADAEVVWIAPSDGEHLLAVTDADGRGGATYAFQFEVEEPRAHFSAVLEGHAFQLRAGGSCVCDVRVLRPVSSDIVARVSAIDLPDGVTAGSVHAAAGLDRVRLVLSAAAAAKPSNSPFRIMVMTTGETPPRVEFARFPLDPRHTDGSGLAVRDCNQPWLTVRPAE
ncbi:MAG TPA: hypothetical protein PK640_04950 [Verrucomicrobiota bacterium]|nr:hypothetical protein [Verrucomicrobiota bacterium]